MYLCVARSARFHVKLKRPKMLHIYVQKHSITHAHRGKEFTLVIVINTVMPTIGRFAVNVALRRNNGWQREQKIHMQRLLRALGIKRNSDNDYKATNRIRTTNRMRVSSLSRLTFLYGNYFVHYSTKFFANRNLCHCRSIVDSLQSDEGKCFERN